MNWKCAGWNWKKRKKSLLLLKIIASPSITENKGDFSAGHWNQKGKVPFL